MNSRGRKIITGPRGGRYVLDEKGRKVYGPVVATQRNAQPQRNAPPPPQRNALGRQIYTGPRGGRYVLEGSTKKYKFPLAPAQPQQPRRPATPPRRPAANGGKSNGSNGSNGSLPPVLKIDGPFLYYKFEFPGGGSLQLFGETHTKPQTGCKPCTQPECMTIAQYMKTLMQRARKNKRRLDIFLEQRWKHKYARGLGCYLVNAVEAVDQLMCDRDPYVRTHHVDLRNMYYPVIHSLYFKQAKDANAAPMAKAVLWSDSYTKNIKPFLKYSNYHRGAYPREIANGDVSRIRKQLLKLPQKLHDSLLHGMHSLLDGTDQAHRIGLLLTDLYMVARMLFYAGFGKTQPAGGIARSSVAYHGASHTINIAEILEHAIRDGALPGVKLVQMQKMKRTQWDQHLDKRFDTNECLSIWT